MRNVAGVNVLPGSEVIKAIGEHHYQDVLEDIQGVLEKVAGTSPGENDDHDAIVVLDPEPSNPQDPQAIGVLIAGIKVGYLPRADAERLHGPVQQLLKLLDGPIGCHATIRRGLPGEGADGLLGVWLRFDRDFGMPRPTGLPEPTHLPEPTWQHERTPTSSHVAPEARSEEPTLHSAAFRKLIPEVSGAADFTELLAFALHTQRELHLLSEQLLKVQRPDEREIAQKLRSLQERAALRTLNETPTTSLGEVTAPGTRIRAVARAYPTLADLAGASRNQLQALEGVGDHTATEVHSVMAAKLIAARQAPLLAPYPDDMTVSDAELVRTIGLVHNAGRVPPSLADALSGPVRSLDELVRRAKKATDRRWKVFGRARRAALRAELELEIREFLTNQDVSDAVVAAMNAVTEFTTPTEHEELRRNYRDHFAGYSAAMDRLGLRHDRSSVGQEWPRREPTSTRSHPQRSTPARWSTHGNRPATEQVRRPRQPIQATPVISRPAWTVPDDGARTWGGLPEELARQIEATVLHTDGLALQLRPYQEFGVSFGAVQGRVVLGDEMGLGKTIEALALMIHLRATVGATRFLVVCPASIIGNWEREIHQHTDLALRLLHGTQRDQEFAQWHRLGGLGLTTYTTARQLPMSKLDVSIDLLVGDECHYIKNPNAHRTRAFASFASMSERAMLMSGTPMENKVQEFVEIVRLLNAPHAAGLERTLRNNFNSALDFQRDIAPVYLRRKQVDVLHELPERIEVEDWIEMAQGERDTYNDHERSGNLMATRRATSVSAGPDSAKIERLGEILDECEADQSKVVVFSFFLDVLDEVQQLVAEPIRMDGAVPTSRRMELVDKFSAADGFKLLVAQIDVGGVGLNLHAANVVVLMEPQLKPTTEWQAIARVHRMGQSRRVIVHRLLVKDTVDEDLFELVAHKAATFKEFADESSLKDESAMATASDALDLKTKLIERMRARQLAS